MTRDELLNSICPMSRVYDCCIADDDYDCDKCKWLTKEWFDEYDKQIRADAIDEFARKLYEGCNEMIETCGSNIAPISWAEAYADFKVDIEEIAEQLKEEKWKAGGKDE